MDMDYFENGLFGEVPHGEHGDMESAQKKIDEEAKAFREKIRSVFGTPDGKEVADFLIYTLCNSYNSPWDKDAMVMAKNAGVQAVGLYFKRILESKE